MLTRGIYVNYGKIYGLSKYLGIIVNLQCEAIRSEQFENGPFHTPTTYEQHVQTIF